MQIKTTQIVYGPGRFVGPGIVIDLPAAEAHQLVNESKATYVHGPYGVPVETATPARHNLEAMVRPPAENATKPNPQATRTKPQGK